MAAPGTTLTVYAPDWVRQLLDELPELNASDLFRRALVALQTGDVAPFAEHLERLRVLYGLERIPVAV